MAQNNETTYHVAPLYVGDLKPEVTEPVLWNAFSGFGQILSVKVCRDSTTGESLGYAYVNFRTLEEAEKAMSALNFTPIEGMPCRIMWSMRDPQKRRNNQGNLFLKNIDSSIDSRALYEAFSVFGPIMSCKLVTDESGKSKGFGFIQFYNDKDADSALEKANGVEFLKKKIMVNKFVPKAQRNGENADGKPKFTNLFIKNFGDEWTTDELKTIFLKFGPITSCVVMTDQNGKSKGFGFVNFEKAEDAEKAVAESSELKTPSGKQVYVARAMKKAERLEQLRQEYNRRRQENIKKCQNLNVYIKPLELTMTEEKLKEEFEKFGNIMSYKIMKDSMGRSRGFGFVCYSTPEEAQKAISEMNGKVIENKPLVVTLAQLKEERRRELQMRNMLRPAGSNAMYGGSVPFMYTPQQINQNYAHQMTAPRFPPVQGIQRTMQRSSQNPVAQVTGGHPRTQVPFGGFHYQNVQYMPRPGRSIQSGNMPQQVAKSAALVGPQQRAYQQVYYTQHPEGQPIRQIVAPHPVQTTVNYVEVTANDGKVAQPDHADQHRPLVTNSDDKDYIKRIVDNVLSISKTLYPDASDAFLSRLTNTVVESIKDNSKIVNNNASLKEVVMNAHNYLIAHSSSDAEAGSAVPVSPT